MASETFSRKPQLNKGKACFNCRHRKVKCDAARPICGPCSRFVGGGLQDCEYTEVGLAQSQADYLTEQISIIESRIQELEQPKELRTSVGLQNPYQPHHSAFISTSSHNTEFRSTSVCTDSIGRLSTRDLTCVFENSTTASLHRGLSSSVSTCLVHFASVRLIFNNSIDSFLRYAPQIGFFLNTHLFDGLSSGVAPSQVASPALLDSIYLWGSHLARSETLSKHESSFLADALRSTGTSLSRAHSATAILHTIQAEVLLAQYFFRNARFLEGKYHASAAVSISLSSGLHKIRSADARAFAVDELSPAATALEEGERINAFWAVLTLNNCWFAADGSPADVSHAAHGIDTPWPLDIEVYSEDAVLLPVSSSATIDNFLANLPDRGTSLPALHAKAAILFEQASQLATQQTETDAAPSHGNTFSAKFNTLDRVIAAFKHTLPPVNLNGTEPRLLVVHTLAHVATIQLHNPFCFKSAGSRARAGAAAMAIVALLRQTDICELGYVDAIFGTLWTAACQVCITELALARGSSRSDSERLCAAIETLLAAMAVFARDCRLIELQLATAQQNYSSVRNR
ncbi:Zn(2)-Cys(6) binuclear cluster domain-containing protein [Mycena belliarum]|uniref:Zn(2)-Cys(6) binuclear cluster domain-containing protein n=1 Tax=Mycena belliarum TaxID=1033014 RepID=A0AAD6UED9_9AGAR|nr:Zn(2)-Cys(6) binuclear cluster domain-containing protein [Mycena belliae]